jgi:hypothetical protein
MTQSCPVIPAPVEPAIGEGERHETSAADIPIEELAEQYQTGATLAEMAALYRSLGYRVIPDEIGRRLIAVGIRIRLIDRPSVAAFRRGRRGSAKFPLSTEELAERYRAGAALFDLALLCGCNSATIRRILFEAGVEIRPRGGRNGTPDQS